MFVVHNRLQRSQPFFLRQPRRSTQTLDIDPRKLFSGVQRMFIPFPSILFHPTGSCHEVKLMDVSTPNWSLKLFSTTNSSRMLARFLFSFGN